MVLTLSKTGFKFVTKSTRCSKADIQTCLQIQSSKGACNLLVLLQLLYLFYCYRRRIYRGSIQSRKCPYPGKACRRCFFCKSVLLNKCEQCTSCYALSSCRGQAAGFLADLGLYESKSHSGIHIKEWLHPPIATKASDYQSFVNPEPVCKPSQTGLITRGVSVSPSKAGHGNVFPRVLQPPLLGLKPNNRWHPIFDLSALNQFLQVKTFKMETQESIRLSLQQGEWVMSLDFSNTYFHIHISQPSRKYMRFQLQGQTLQFRALPFSIATSPMEFTIVVTEVKLVA